MGTKKVGVYRKYHGPVPIGSDGKPLPKEAWGNKRPFSWSARWFGIEGQRYSKSFRTRREAERFAEKQQASVRAGKADPPPDISLRDFYREHLGFMKGSIAPTTHRMHAAVIELLAGEVGWQRALRRITVRDIERFRSKRLQAGIAPSTANKELGTLKRIFNLGILRQYVPEDSNPCIAVQMLKIASKRPQYFSPEKFQKVFEAASDLFWRVFLTTIYTTAIRLGEALNLTWQDIDLDAAELHVTRKTARKWVQPWTPKDHEMRTIPMPPQTVELLAALKATAPSDCPYVFMDEGRWDYYREQVESGQWTASRCLVNNVLRRFRTLCRRGKVGHYTIHDLRRSCITNWAKKAPIHVVQKLAGHSDIKTTQQFYLSVQSEDFVKARDAQEALLPDLNGTVTDPKLTHKPRKRSFSGRRAFEDDLKGPAK